MPTKDGFTPDYPLPVFLAEYGDEPEQPDIGKSWDRAVVSSRIFKTSVLVVTATAIGVAILSAANPVVPFANIMASLVDTSALPPGTGQSAPAIQSIAQTLPPTAIDAPTSEKIAAPVESTNQIAAESSEPPAEDLLRQFQAWAAEEDTRAPVVPVQPMQPAQVVQDDRAQVVEDAPAPVRHIQRHPRIRSVQNARAEIRPERHPRAHVRREQNARTEVAPVPDPRVQDPPAQNAQTPSLLQSFGWH